MQTLRLSLVGTVILVLLGGLGVAVLAQDEAETAPEVSREAAVFQGEVPYPFRVEDGTKEGVPEARMTKWRDREWEGRLSDVSDPRLAGTHRYRVNGDFYGDALLDVMTAATRIDNAEGSWLGHLTGYHDTSGTSEGSRWHWQGALTGNGAYEGLTALVFMDTAGTSSGYDIHGMVFPGELPEAPEYPAVSE